MKKLFPIFIVLFSFLLTGVSSAQSAEEINKKITPEVITNFVMAINSDNPGLRKSAIYLVGKYKMEQAVDALIKVLNTDNQCNMKMRAALALYDIGSPKALTAVLKSSIWNEDGFAKELKTIYFDYERDMEKRLSF